MLKLAHDIIKPPPLDMVPKEIRDNPKHFSYFKDCIGAIDGIHVSATLPIPTGDHQIADKNLAHYANPNIAATTHTSAAIDDEGPPDQVIEINIIKKNIANQLARDNQFPPI
ncbi:hypothetical protein K1719_013115 [Acacia pycnantha]|nr:hypothetical protein K1719_013115 [Acacia pycnantha]